MRMSENCNSSQLNSDNKLEEASVEVQAKSAVLTSLNPCIYETCRNGSGLNAVNDSEDGTRKVFSPLLRRPQTPNIAGQQETEMDPNLVAMERYDPQSKAFSYVPKQALHEHFKSPKKHTMVMPMYEKLPFKTANASDISSAANKVLNPGHCFQVTKFRLSYFTLLL